MGDALAMAVAHRKRFAREDFALFHPGGSIGRSLVRVGEVMRDRSQATIVTTSTKVIDAVREMSRPGRARTGIVIVSHEDLRLAGVFTDGDLRRLLVADPRALERPIAAVMTSAPKVADRGELLADVYKRLKEFQINELPVLDEEQRVVGTLHVQDVVEWGVAF
jgi:arabinose-5-phosphate isomerase